MPSYNWLDLDDAKRPLPERLSKRFPEWARGSDAWRWFVGKLLSKAEPSPLILEEFRASVGPILPVLTCPRIFISHRQSDSDLALRIADLSTQKGFEFWLDVLTPSLQALQQATAELTTLQQALLTAGIIEMALINSTHAAAVITKKTRGSLWVPYEYGRVKDASTVSGRVGSWIHPNLPSSDFPEYMVLGVVVRKEKEIRKWLRDELLVWRATYKACTKGAKITWTWGPTQPLPEAPNPPAQPDSCAAG